MPNARADAGHDGDYEGGYDRTLDLEVGRLLALAREDLDTEVAQAAEESLARGAYRDAWLAIAAGIESGGVTVDPELRGLLEHAATVLG